LRKLDQYAFSKGFAFLNAKHWDMGKEIWLIFDAHSCAALSAGL